MEKLTVKNLYEMCQNQIRKGNGDKIVCLSRDDEGNGYHYLWYDFLDDKKSIKMIEGMDMLPSGADPNNIVLLG